MNKPNNTGRLLIGCAILIELAAVILIVKASASDTSSSLGLALLAIGLVFLVIGVRKGTRE